MTIPLEALGICADRITLLTEGTYPHSQGGVSVWCDQLVSGLPEFDFRVLAVTGSGREPLAWQLPPGVCGLTTVPLWGPPPAGRVPRGRRKRELLAAYECFLHSLLDPRQAREFAGTLYALAEAARAGHLSATLRTETAVRTLHRLWRQPQLDVAEARPTLHDALTATDLIEHSLRPLHRPPPDTGICHAVSGGLAALPGLAAGQLHGVPLLLTEHGLYLRERYLGHRTASYRWPVKALLLGFFRLLAEETYRRAALVTPCSDYNRRWQLHGGTRPQRIRTVHNGVDPGAFPHAGPEPPQPTLVWAGRIDPIKDLETLIRAFALVRVRVPGARLRLFGGAAPDAEGYLRRCVALAAELGLEDAVVFEGRVSDVRGAYASGSLVMLSSISEGFPFTLIEGMSCGRTAVATDVGGVREALGDTGTVVPPRDPVAMARAVVELLHDPERRAEMGERARERVIAQFTLHRTLDAFRGIYHELHARQRWQAATRVVRAAG